MKVLHFLDTTGRGGAETQVLDVCRNAGDFGLDLTFVTAQGGALENEFRSSGADFVKMSRRFPVDIYLASQLRKIIKEREIEIVHGYQPVEGLHLYLAARGLKNVKKVLSFQGFVFDRKNRLTAKFLIPRMDANIVVSEGLKKFHETVDGFDTKNFQVIYNGADIKRLEPTGKSLREELGLPEDVLLIGMIGNFYRDPRKDQFTICKTLPKVFAEIPNVHCVFAGKIEEGAEEKTADCINFCIENKIIERVHFLGGRSDVPDILAALDLFVFSSLYEGLPVALSEAMLAGVPLIVSDIEPLLEATDNGKYAEVFPVGNAEILSEKILKLLLDEKARKDLATRANEYAKENFSIEAHLRKLKNLYQSLL
ncbi:MAG TPA: glycosyltransferase [Pyrinomonadaceae bacterium]|nr:glycosyltransferase [Pyrinomonadaceae bacterium]